MAPSSALVQRGEQQADHSGVDAHAAPTAMPGRPRSAPHDGRHADQQQERRHVDRHQRDGRAEPAVRAARVHDGAQVRGEREQRAGDRLRGAVAGQELLVVDPARRHHLGLQQRQHDVAAAEDQRADAVEAVEEGQTLARCDPAQERQPEQEREEQDPCSDGRRVPIGMWIRCLLLSVTVGSSRQPIRPATTMTSTCAAARGSPSDGAARMTSAAAMARLARSRSGARLRAIDHTASATTATATTSSPCSQPAASLPTRWTRPANRTSSDRRRQSEPEPGRQPAQEAPRAECRSRCRPGYWPGRAASDDSAIRSA